MLLGGGICRAWLVLHKDNTNHFLGVGLFCVGSSLYSISFVLLAGRTHQHLRAVHNALLAFLLLSTCALALAFILLKSGGPNTKEPGREVSTSEE